MVEKFIWDGLFNLQQKITDCIDPKMMAKSSGLESICDLKALKSNLNVLCPIKIAREVPSDDKVINIRHQFPEDAG